MLAPTVTEHNYLRQQTHAVLMAAVFCVQAFNVEHEQTVGQLQQQLSAAKQGLVERDEIIQRFKEVTAADAMPPMTTAQHGSPSPHITAAQNGSSPVQAYSKYVALSHEHNKLQREHERLQADWEQVCCVWHSLHTFVLLSMQRVAAFCVCSHCDGLTVCV